MKSKSDYIRGKIFQQNTKVDRLQASTYFKSDSRHFMDPCGRCVSLEQGQKCVDVMLRKNMIVLANTANICSMANWLSAARPGCWLVASESFLLHLPSQGRIEDIKMQQRAEAEKMIQNQFKIEQIVYCQDNFYRKALRDTNVNNVEEALKTLKFQDVNGIVPDKSPSTVELACHLEAYFNVSFWIPVIAIPISF